jgi:uncharacterized protein (TIGR03437 family)
MKALTVAATESLAEQTNQEVKKMMTIKTVVRRAAMVVLAVGVSGLFAQTIPVINAVVNGASFGGAPMGAVANDTWLSIFGASLALSTRPWNGSDFIDGQPPTSLDGVSVDVEVCTTPSTCAHEPAYIGYISPAQLNVVVIYDAAVLQMLPANAQFMQAQITVTTAQGSGVYGSSYLSSYDPGFFTFPSSNPIFAYVAARHADGTIVLPASPAKPGETISLYGTGFGNASLAMTMILGPSGPTGNTNEHWAAEVKPQYTGLVGLGLYQINITIPDGAPTGDVLLSGEIVTGSEVFVPSPVLIPIGE